MIPVSLVPRLAALLSLPPPPLLNVLLLELLPLEKMLLDGESPPLLNTLLVSRVNVPMGGKRVVVWVALDEPYSPLLPFPKEDDLSCSRGKSGAKRELEFERLKLNACGDLPFFCKNTKTKYKTEESVEWEYRWYLHNDVTIMGL